jgi:hypothetical protein
MGRTGNWDELEFSTEDGEKQFSAIALNEFTTA